MFVSLCDVWVQVRGQLEVLRGACREVQGSQNFTTLLRAILALGNHLNEGTHKGNASGFTLPPPLLPPVPLHCKPPPPPKSPPPPSVPPQSLPRSSNPPFFTHHTLHYDTCQLTSGKLVQPACDKAGLVMAPLQTQVAASAS